MKNLSGLIYLLNIKFEKHNFEGECSGELTVPHQQLLNNDLNIWN